MDPTAKLSAHGIAALESIRVKPRPACETNAGVNRQLVSLDLATYVMLPTPYKTRKGDISHLQITAAGKHELVLIEEAAIARRVREKVLPQ